MEQGSVETDGGSYVEDAHGLRLMAALDAMVREHDVKWAAEQLDVDTRTLVTCLRRGRLSGHLRAALNLRLLQERDRTVREETAEQVRGLAQQVGDIAERVTALAGEVDGLCSSVVQEMGALREEQAGAVRGLERRVARIEGVQRGGPGAAGGVEGTTTTASASQGEPVGKRVYRRTRPRVVTAEAEDGEEDVYGDAEPLVIAWRNARTVRLAARGRLAYAEATERQMSLEIALMEGHGLTLAPERDPFDSLKMHSELKWRRLELAAARQERRRALRRRWLRRMLTLGLWWE